LRELALFYAILAEVRQRGLGRLRQLDVSCDGLGDSMTSIVNHRYFIYESSGTMTTGHASNLVTLTAE
jgi:hypothetical protein